MCAERYESANNKERGLKEEKGKVQLLKEEKWEWHEVCKKREDDGFNKQADFLEVTPEFFSCSVMLK